ncbi:MAG: hypothetical protein AAGU27_28190 [Dehalobacterium sp.]
MGCKKVVAPVAPAVIAPCNPFRSIVGLIVVLIVIEFLCGIFTGECGGYDGLAE